MTHSEVLVVGGGAGAIALAHHLNQCGGPTPTLVEARAWGGPAYTTTSPSHLLNVPAGRMGLNPQDPSDFLAWWRESEPEAQAGAFVPRSRYGRYLGSVLDGLLVSGRVRTVSGEVLGLDRTQDGWLASLADGQKLAARQVVLAPGPFPPAHPPTLSPALMKEAPGRYVSDPWRSGPLPPLPPEAPVALVGTGLTAIDLALALADAGHRGPLWLLGRRGLLPRAHAAGPLPPAPAALTVGDRLPLSQAVAALRRAAREAPGGWHAAVDALRASTPELWASWSEAERRRFLRHARPFWEAHRHRMAPQVAERVQGELDTGRWRLVSGRLLGIEALNQAPDAPLTVRLRPRGASEGLALQVARLYNATGPEADARRLERPLVRGLLAAGLVAADPLGLGLATGHQGELLDAQGQPSPGLWALGALRKGRLWESTALPELRAQAAALAQLLSGR